MMRTIFSGIAIAFALTGPAMALEVAPQEVPESAPLGLIALGIVGVAIAYRLRNRK